MVHFSHRKTQRRERVFLARIHREEAVGASLGVHREEAVPERQNSKAQAEYVLTEVHRYRDSGF